MNTLRCITEVLPKTMTAVQQSASLQGAEELDYSAPAFSLEDSLEDDPVAKIDRLYLEQIKIRQDNLKRLIVEANARAAKLEVDLANLHGKYRSLCSLASMTTVGCVVLLILQFR